MSQGINDTIERAGTFQSGATPLEESNLPLHIPRQPTLPAMTKEQIKAAAWSLTEMLSQEKLVKTIDLGTSSTESWMFEHTVNNVFDLHFRSLSQFFRLASWTLHFRFQFRSNFQQVGQVLVTQHNIPHYCLGYLLPSNGDPRDRLRKNYRLMTMLPHTKVPMGEDVDVNAELQWNLPIPAAYLQNKSYDYSGTDFATVPYDFSMGEIYVTVPWAMEMAEGVNPTLSMRIWSRLSNVTLSAYDPTDASF